MPNTETDSIHGPVLEGGYEYPVTAVGPGGKSVPSLPAVAETSSSVVGLWVLDAHAMLSAPCGSRFWSGRSVVLTHLPGSPIQIAAEGIRRFGSIAWRARLVTGAEESASPAPSRDLAGPPQASWPPSIVTVVPVT